MSNCRLIGRSVARLEERYVAAQDRVPQPADPAVVFAMTRLGGAGAVRGVHGGREALQCRLGLDAAVLRSLASRMCFIVYVHLLVVLEQDSGSAG